MFDVGYTLIDETRRWREWARWLEVADDALFTGMRTAIADGIHHVEALRRLKPGFDLARARADRARAGGPDEFIDTDLYPDVPPCITRLKAAGLRVGAAGNMSADVEEFLRSSGLTLDMIGSSQRWGIEKPDRAFFHRVSEEINLPPAQVAYVGDRIDNDVAPAASVGMCAIFLKRGLWAAVQAGRPEQALAHAVIESLDALPAALP